jgi:Ca2+/H+ antiporter, TMEM165/GDT1 family
MFADFLAPLAAVGLAELGDKTQIAVLMMASKTKQRTELLLGVLTGFLIVDGLAVLAGAWAGNLIPYGIIKPAAGAVFMAFGILTAFDRSDDKGDEVSGRGPFFSGLLTISLMELGDKTQVTAALFATEYDPFMVLCGAMTALTALSAAAVYLGNYVSAKLERRLLKKIAGAVFFAIGLTFILL